MFFSRPVVHPVMAPPEAGENRPPPHVWMSDIQGTPGTRGSLLLRVLQFVSALVTVAIITATNNGDFTSSTAFIYLVAAFGLLIFWSVSLALCDIHALLVLRGLGNSVITWIVVVGDGIVASITFSAVFGSFGVTYLLFDDRVCDRNHCSSFGNALSVAFISWFITLPSFMLNLLSVLPSR